MSGTARRAMLGAFTLFAAAWVVDANDSVQPPEDQLGIVGRIDQRFAGLDRAPTPDFQKHVAPLLGRLGCNGCACHGSFQGRGGFRLSLFGYDFKSDHDALLDGRVDVDDPDYSLVIFKPTDADEHEGGMRYEKGSWQHHVLRKWIEDGARFEHDKIHQLTRLNVTPSELQFGEPSEQVQLQVVAVWQDGTREDVTPLCRFQTNDDQIAEVTENGLVTSKKQGDTHVVIFYDSAVLPIPVIQPVTQLVGKRYPEVPTPTEVDRLVVSKLRKLGIVPSERSSDAVFLRRVSLDITGTLPTADQAEAFLSDPSPDKREAKIKQLLDSPAYAAWWTTKLCDFTGNNDYNLRNIIPEAQGQANGYLPSKTWYDWIYKRVAADLPYDQIVAGIVLATTREPNRSYTEYSERMCEIYRGASEQAPADLPTMPWYWARRDLLDAEPRAISFAHAFLGIRIQCAQCHKHPFDQWSKEDFAEFTNFFRQARYYNNLNRLSSPRHKDEVAEHAKIVSSLNVNDQLRGGQLRREYGRLMMEEGKTIPFPEVVIGSLRASRSPDAAQTDMTSAKLLGGEAFEIKSDEDIRKPLMEWLRDRDNPYFARALVNRVWAAYFGRGIVEPTDDHSLANPPSNKPLLEYLAEGFIESGFDLKWVHRTIANSRTYQLSWEPNETNRRDEVNFSRALPRRLPAEVVYDVLHQATANFDDSLAMQAEVEGRAIAIAGASARNMQRGNRDAGYAMQVFGKSVRETNCDCDRSSQPNLLQTVFLQNDDSMHSMLARKKGWLDQMHRELALDQPAARRPDVLEALKVEQIDAESRRAAAQAARDWGAKSAEQMRQQLETKAAVAQLVGAALDGLNDSRKLLPEDAELKELAERFEAHASHRKQQLHRDRKLAAHLHANHEKSTAQLTDSEKTLARIRSRLEQLEQTQLQQSETETEALAKVSLIQDAYLRTLCRYPDRDELSRCVQYLNEAEDELSGLRGVLWALLNTKEFIVNH